MSQPPQNNYPRPNQPGQPPYPQQQPNNYPPQGYYQGQQPYPGQQPGYPPQAPYQGAYPAQKVKVPGNWKLYLIPLLGAILLAVGAFLPWITLTIVGQTISVSGIGSVSGTSDLVSAYNQAGGGGAKDGTIALALAGISLILILIGLLTRARGWAIGVIVFGVFATGLMAYELYDIGKSTSTLASDTAGAGASSTGFGIYIGLAGAIIILVGAIITVAFFRKKQV
jgi:hypothetical protein